MKHALLLLSLNDVKSTYRCIKVPAIFAKIICPYLFGTVSGKLRSKVLKNTFSGDGFFHADALISCEQQIGPGRICRWIKLKQQPQHRLQTCKIIQRQTGIRKGAILGRQRSIEIG